MPQPSSVREPCVVVLGGPNGAGKSTAAPRLLRGALRVDEFVNADLLAQGLSAFKPETAAVEAGRVMLRRFQELVRTRTSFACESTLASLTLAKHLVDWKRLGYRIYVVYLWLPKVDLALRRVRLRVESGGHDVPSETVRRRFERGRHRFFHTYLPLSDRWRLYDASSASGPELIDWQRRRSPSYPEARQMAARKHRRRVGRRLPTISEIFDQGTAIDEALRLGVQDALIRHKQLGQSVAVWHDGRVVVLTADEIPVATPARRNAARFKTSRPPRRR